MPVAGRRRRAPPPTGPRPGRAAPPPASGRVGRPPSPWPAAPRRATRAGSPPPARATRRPLRRRRGRPARRRGPGDRGRTAAAGQAEHRDHGPAQARGRGALAPNRLGRREQEVLDARQRRSQKTAALGVCAHGPTAASPFTSSRRARMRSGAGGLSVTRTRPDRTRTRARLRDQPGSASRAPARVSASGQGERSSLGRGAGEHARVAHDEGLHDHEAEYDDGRHHAQQLDQRLAALVAPHGLPPNELRALIDTPDRRAGRTAERGPAPLPGFPDRCTRRPRSSERGARCVLTGSGCDRPRPLAPPPWRHGRTAKGVSEQRQLPGRHARQQHRRHSRDQLYRCLTAVGAAHVDTVAGTAARNNALALRNGYKSATRNGGIASRPRRPRTSRARAARATRARRGPPRRTAGWWP